MKTKTKTKVKTIYVANGTYQSINPAYVFQLARAKYKYCRIVQNGDMGNYYIFTNKKISSRQAMFLSLKKVDKSFLDDFALEA